MGLARKDAKKLVEEYQEWLRYIAENDIDIKDRVFAVLYEVDEHWRMVVNEAWETVSQAENAGQFGTKTSALKLIATINKDRANMFQEAGVNQDTEIIEQMNETQRKHEVIIKVLKEVKREYPEAANLIAKRLSEVQDEVEVIEIEDG